MDFGVVSLFPEMFQALTEYGVTGRAYRDGLYRLRFWNPRAFAEDPHRTVDDRPYGGGPGMVMMPKPAVACLRAAKQAMVAGENNPRIKTVYLSPQGQPLKQSDVRRLAQEPRLLLLAGRYEGIDERIIESEVDEEWSIGDYVLSGGELPAMVLMDALVRLLPGALGHADSARQDSFMDGLLDCPHYTRPEIFEGRPVPSILLSGDHAKIKQWRWQQSLGRTAERRPELLAERSLSETEQALLDAYRHQREEQEGDR